ncbi:hypothetical protein DL96DRAFT_1603756 [Flagelloscypha sp. PMI_526]|nr:hypothetical protein DL96DRAFT_1603756 [Flagelloscypha sp. PMI_526]
MPTAVLNARVTYKKLPGTLLVTQTHLLWTQDGQKTPMVNVSLADLASLFCSKEGSKDVKIKISINGDDSGFMFNFTSPQPVALVERKTIQNHLSSIISQNRNAPGNGLSNGSLTSHIASSISAGPVTPRPQHRPSPGSSKTPSHTPSRAPSSIPEARPTSIVLGSNPQLDFQLRKRVLLGNRELSQLHRNLVIGGQITEQEFWEGREHLLLSQAAQDTQKKGKSGQLVDPRPETIDGDTKIRVTPQLIQDIFEEYPIVQKAYSENVPSKMNESDFWQRYFQSKLFNAHRASIRSSAVQHVAKDDEIFDKYLEKDDDGLEPRRQIDTTRVDLLLDMAATIEDHEETGNENDVTMQAGKQKAALPLIRKFNEHSERLLNSALGDLPSAKRRRLDSSAAQYVNDIALEDLVDPESSAGITLDMKNREQYFEARARSVDQLGREALDPRLVLSEARSKMDGWDLGDAAMAAMTKNVSARMISKSKKSGLFQQMTSCQAATNEFLRQFWTSTHPPPIDEAMLHVPTQAQRTAKIAKMVVYLSNTHEKVESLVQIASKYSTDGAKVRTALQPMLNAVDKALAYHQARVTK